MTLVAAIDKCISEYDPDLKTPKPIDYVLPIIRKVHQLWRWHQQSIRFQENGFMKQVGLSLISKWVVQDENVQRAAKFLLIVRRTKALYDQKKEVTKAYRIFKKEFSKKVPLSFKPSILKQRELIPINPLSFAWIQLEGELVVFKLKILIKKVQKTWKMFLKVSKETFTLSMRYLDALDAFNPSKSEVADELIEIALNISAMKKELGEFKEFADAVAKGLDWKDTTDHILNSLKFIGLSIAVKQGASAVLAFASGGTVSLSNSTPNYPGMTQKGLRAPVGIR